MKKYIFVIILFVSSFNCYTQNKLKGKVHFIFNQGISFSSNNTLFNEKLIVNLSGGYKIKKNYLGFGIALDNYGNIKTKPIYLDYRRDFKNPEKNNTPFLYSQIGFTTISKKIISERFANNGSSNLKNNKGLYTDIGLGYLVRLRDKRFSFVAISIGYSYKKVSLKLPKKYWQPNPRTPQIVYKSGEFNSINFKLNIGI